MGDIIAEISDDEKLLEKC